MMQIPVLIVNDTRVDQHHGCTAVVQNLISLLESFDFEIVGVWPAHRNWRDEPQFMNLVARAKLILINGEGSIHHNSRGAIQLLGLGELAKNLGIPAALINTGWEANSQELGMKLKDFSFIAARDSFSASQMIKFGQAVNVVPDLSLLTTFKKCHHHENLIGVTDNVDIAKSFELMHIKNQLGAELVSIHSPNNLYKFIRSVISFRKDLTNPQKILKLSLLRSSLWHNSEASLPKFLDTLSTYDLLVSGRYHACTLALVTGTPFVTQESNTQKISSLLRDANLNPFRSAIPKNLDRHFDLREFSWTKLENEAINHYLNHARTAAEKMLKEIRSLMH